MIEKIKQHKSYVVRKIEKLLRKKAGREQLQKIENQYLLACFLKIADKQDYKKLNLKRCKCGEVLNNGLVYDGTMIYILTHLDEYIGNMRYYQRYIKLPSRLGD